MRFTRFNTLYRYMFLATGLGTSGSLWAQETVNTAVQLPTIKVEATRTDTEYLKTTCLYFPY